jgi:hypothetical protein
LTTGAEAVQDFNDALRFEAHILESLGRLDEAMAVDAEWAALKPGEAHPGVFVRRAIRHIAEGEDAVAERLLRRLMPVVPADWEDESFNMNFTSSLIESTFRPHTMLAELLERKGTGEALAEARMLRDKVAEQLARHDTMRAAALEETRAGAAEAVRQWREERSKERGEAEGGRGKGKKKKGKKARARGKGPSSAPAIEGEPPHEPAGEELERAAAEEEGGPAAAGAEQQAPEGESAPPDDEEEVREECAICLQDLELEDDEDPWVDEGGEGEALVVLRCGHRFHAICGDMWCAKCADKGWGVTCPGCRAPYVLVRDE